MQTGLLAAVALMAVAAEPGEGRPPVRPFEGQGELKVQNRIDEFVFARWKQLGIRPAKPCSDSVFVRRVYLDVIGTLPTAREAREFLLDREPDKRQALIERLLERDEFADYWALKWGDLLRVKAEFPINLWPNAAQAYHRWIRTSIRENAPYDRFVRELLTANGSNFRVPQVNFFRAMQNREPPAIAQAVALTFLGTRTENWPKERLAGMAAFFSRLRYKSTAEWKEEIIFFDPDLGLDSGVGGAAAPAMFPDGTSVRLPMDRDPRAVFADWLLAPGNPWLARNIVNRIWAWLQGRGIIHEPDDLRPDNPPSNPELLTFLEKELVEAHYDLRHIYRLILNSSTYQLSPLPQGEDPRAEVQFAYYPTRRLEAEVLIDALNQITGTTESYSSPIPEPFTFVPEEQRAIALADGSVSSPFLEMFGRSPRDTGLESERTNRITAEQRLHLLNSSHIQRKIEQSPKLTALMQTGSKPRDVIDGFYLTILSRLPTEAELLVLADYAQSGTADRRAVPVDIAWALINTTEFLYRH
jgi:hypothetical protein